MWKPKTPTATEESGDEVRGQNEDPGTVPVID